jgi:formate hydrogenlyase transcriptional activator
MATAVQLIPWAEPESTVGGNLIGCSTSLSRVWNMVQRVAPTNASVLIQGETGTGKELVARAIHDESTRRSRPFVTINCAAIPSALLESELFGHERGAFTGAIMQTTGRFQMADGGTLFLDEVGDLPLELQPKLLRVLQEQEFERLGSTRTIRVDVRIVAATNQDLAQLVAEKRFRADLFYRLNVIPISLPPLRERQEDIPLLMRHFVSKFAAKMNKTINHIPSELMESARLYDWPGNIRELQNLAERAVIMTPGPVLRIPPSELKPLLVMRRTPTAVQTLVDVEKQHILNVLEEVNWVVGGPNGAARRLGMARTTLLYRMQKLGISPSRTL